jgi:hypothetical protein
MIVCAECGSAKGLHIVQSRIVYPDGESIDELEETYECVMCDSKGRLHIREEDGVKCTSIQGDVIEIDERPQIDI